jgi:peroxiredoxin (alkyl hydroperoxide reductase subunit C)
MLTVGHPLPSFHLTAAVSSEPGHEFADITERSYPGSWLVLFSWPMDFTFVCPTEIAEFGKRDADFRALGAQVLGLSCDTNFVHLAWRKAHPDLRTLPFPMLADFTRSFSTALGIIHPIAGVPSRATFLIDPEGIIRFATVNDLNAGRSIPEVLRVLAALKTGELTPCNWHPGEKTLKVG